MARAFTCSSCRKILATPSYRNPRVQGPLCQRCFRLSFDPFSAPSEPKPEREVTC